MKPIRQRLYEKCVRMPNGCLEFQGAKLRFGYGHMGRGGRGDGYASTHRIAWELERGPIPKGLYVLHHCDNPPCCEVEHLFLGTLSDNTQDMLRKGRARGHFVGGEAHNDARLSDADVWRLRALSFAEVNYEHLAYRFDISHQHARALVLEIKRPNLASA